MKKLNIILIFMLFITIATAQSKVAVFDPADDSNTGYAEIVREILSTGLTNSKNFKPVERAMIQQVLQENKYQATGLVDENKISELGKQMGADFVCVSILKKMGDNYFITAKLVNVTTGSVELQQYVKTDDGDNDLFEKVEELSEKMFEGGVEINNTNNNNETSIAKLNIYRFHNYKNRNLTLFIQIDGVEVGSINNKSIFMYEFSDTGNKKVSIGHKGAKSNLAYHELGSLTINVSINNEYYIEIDCPYKLCDFQQITYENIHQDFKNKFDK